jgi:transglutaminase-like putative cysteine protease
MRYRINHKTYYKFSSKVFLEPHVLRLNPKTTPHHRLESFSLNISPKPIGLSQQIDAEGNFSHFCWFDGKTDFLTLNFESVVHTRQKNPFNFILYPTNYQNLPISYSELDNEILKPTLITSKISLPLIEYGKKIQKESANETIRFLTNLTKKIHSDFSVEHRHKGNPLEPDKTFLLTKGSCRDLAWMQLQLLRTLGIACKFVSGYTYIPGDIENFELHAWIEVFLPGAGWIGLDPSHGIFTTELYFPVAASVHYSKALPVTGTIRGNASSKLSTKLLIKAL